MGKLIKNHWARLVILTAAACKFNPTQPIHPSIHPPPPQPHLTNPPDQIAAAIESFFWPKIFWDFATKNLDGAVTSAPILQILNILCGIIGLAWEWPLPLLAGTGLHRSIEARLVFYPLSALVALLIYQGTNAGLYYIIGMGAYFWAFSQGEVCFFFPFFFLSKTPKVPKSPLLPTQTRTITNNPRPQIVCPEPWTLPKRSGNRRQGA